jgi:hypothetical protein
VPVEKGEHRPEDRLGRPLCENTDRDRHEQEKSGKFPRKINRRSGCSLCLDIRESLVHPYQS